jgi:membrane-associated phospholipid phosphatase
MSKPSGLVDRALRVFGDVRPGEGTTVLLMCLNVYLLLGTAVALALLLGLAPVARAADTAVVAADPVPGVEVGVRDDGRRTMRRLPANLGRGTFGVFHADNLVPFLVGGSAAASASFFDQDVRDSLQGDTLNWGDTLETGAGPVWSTVFVAGMFTAGRLSHGSRFRAMSYDMLDAAVINFGYTELVKVAVGRERPNQENNKSFPSGHTSNSFALAAVAERHYGWKIGVPAYLLAGLVGASRLEQDKHYLSDVVAGATLGYIVGRSVVRVNGRPLEDGSHRGTQVNVAPIVARHARGLQLSVVF